MLRLGWAPYLCSADSLIKLEILGRYPVKLQSQLDEAGRAFEAALIATGYENPCDFTGSYMCRTIGGTQTWSTHAYGCAIDLDYGGDTDGDGDPTIDSNPHLRRPVIPEDFGRNCQILEHQVWAVENIRNTRGERMWHWLGYSIGDTMHFQIAVSPEHTTVDWSTVAGEENEMWLDDWDDLTWMTVFDFTDVPDVDGEGRYYCQNDGTYIFGSRDPYGPWDPSKQWPWGRDGQGHNHKELKNAINHVWRGYAAALDQS